MINPLQGPFWIDPAKPDASFPPVEYALEEPNGLLAVGGDLRPQRLLSAYKQGIFPWYNEGQPILWWSPNPRCVLHPTEIHISRSLRKTLRKSTFRISMDTAFAQVIQACAQPRPYARDTWINTAMQQAYEELHHAGHAHSIEVWQDQQLVGGLYGLAIGRVFFGESMFSRVPNASKIAFAHLCRQLDRWHYPLIDCQVESRHLQQLGARTLPREDFLRQLTHYCALPGRDSPWTCEPTEPWDQTQHISLP